MKRAVVLLSGGVDSSTTLAIAKSECWELYALSFNYGQRNSVELTAAKRVVEAIGVKEHKIFSIDLVAIGGSELTEDLSAGETLAVVQHDVSMKSQVQGFHMGSGNVSDEFRNSQEPSHHRDTFGTMHKDENEVKPRRQKKARGVPATYVPARNTIFLSIALAWAEVLSAGDIFIGVNAVDYSGYPDCRPEYIDAFEKLSSLATVFGGVKIHAPLMHMSKAEIVKKGLALGVDYSMTQSCYEPDADGIACGKCESCKIRKKGFEEAGVDDPIPYTDDCK